MKLVRIVSFIFAIQPMLDVYGIGIKGVGLGKAIMIILTLMCLLKKTKGITILGILKSTICHMGITSPIFICLNPIVFLL